QAAATELVGSKVDVIVALALPHALAAKAATRTIPIVFAGNDAVQLGLIASLARPGGNLTGIEWGDIDLAPKRVQLLKEAIPRTRRGALSPDPSFVLTQRWVAESQAPARGLNMQPQPVGPDVSQLDNAFATITASGADAVLVLSSPAYYPERRRIIELA